MLSTLLKYPKTDYGGQVEACPLKEESFLLKQSTEDAGTYVEHSDESTTYSVDAGQGSGLFIDVLSSDVPFPDRTTREDSNDVIYAGCEDQTRSQEDREGDRVQHGSDSSDVLRLAGVKFHASDDLSSSQVVFQHLDIGTSLQVFDRTFDNAELTLFDPSAG